MGASPDEAEFKALRDEYQSLRSEVELAIRNQVRILGYGGTVLGIFAGIGVIRPSLLVVTALPFIAFFFAVLWSVEQTRMMRAGDYISTIEDRLNEEQFEEPVMLWESWLRFRAGQHPERDIYQIHYWSQYLIIGVFITTELIGILTLWFWQPGGVEIQFKVGLTVLYFIFIYIMYYLLQKVVKHKDIGKSFGRFRENAEG